MKDSTILGILKASSIEKQTREAMTASNVPAERMYDLTEIDLQIPAKLNIRGFFSHFQLRSSTSATAALT